MINKVAEDALFPAQIDAGTEPELQREDGVPSQLSQGSEAGSNTPRESAPTTGEAQGRELISSNEAAINATKRDAKTMNARAALKDLLSEEALSSSYDRVLNETLDNTPSAGVKISAARELLKKVAASSPEMAKKIRALAKLAHDPLMAEEGAAPASAISAPSDEAIEAARAGVTPEELAQAAELLAVQEVAGQEGELPQEAPMGEEVPPVAQAPAGEAEKGSQLGMSAPSATSPTMSPSFGGGGM
jgi:hypothetical protein